MGWMNGQTVRERGRKECVEGRREGRKKGEKRQRGVGGNKGGRLKKNGNMSSNFNTVKSQIYY